MKKLTFILLLTACSLKVHATDVYIILGQSNGWRISSISNFPGPSDSNSIHYFPMKCTSRPETTELTTITSVHPSCQGRGIAEELLKLSGEDIIIVQYCVCGSSLHAEVNWYPGEDPKAGRVNNSGLYGKFLKYLANARSQAEAAGHEWKIKAAFWHQGEADSNQHAIAYERNFRHLLLRLRSDLRKDLPVIAGKIRELSEPAKAVNRALDNVATSDNKLAVVPVNDLPGQTPTDVHFNTEGCQMLGRRMVKAYAKMVSR